MYMYIYSHPIPCRMLVKEVRVYSDSSLRHTSISSRAVVKSPAALCGRQVYEFSIEHSPTDFITKWVPYVAKVLGKVMYLNLSLYSAF